jgi:hypothetical protein
MTYRPILVPGAAIVGFNQDSRTSAKSTSRPQATAAVAFPAS